MMRKVSDDALNRTDCVTFDGVAIDGLVTAWLLTWKGGLERRVSEQDE
jgi:hypothetical protein